MVSPCLLTARLLNESHGDFQGCWQLKAACRFPYFDAHGHCLLTLGRLWVTNSRAGWRTAQSSRATWLHVFVSYCPFSIRGIAIKHISASQVANCAEEARSRGFLLRSWRCLLRQQGTMIAKESLCAVRLVDSNVNALKRLVLRSTARANFSEASFDLHSSLGPGV